MKDGKPDREGMMPTHAKSKCENSIQFKALFRVDVNHTYNTSSNELLKSTMGYNNTYNYAIQYRHKGYRHKLQKQISTEQKQAKNKRLMHLSNNKK